MKFRAIKNSMIVKLLLLLSMFLLGIASLYYAYHIIYYVTAYESNAVNYTQTSKFQSLYQKYINYTAIYGRYKEDGYTSDPNSIYATTDFSSINHGLFNNNLVPAEFNDLNISQENFEYYNYILNTENPDFFYYIKNQTTNKYYYSSALENYLKKQLNLSAKETLTSEMIETYFNQNVKQNYPFLVLNTANQRYYTNIPSEINQSISEDTLQSAIDYLKKSEVFPELNYSIQDVLYIETMGLSIYYSDFQIIADYFYEIANYLLGYYTIEGFDLLTREQIEQATYYILNQISSEDFYQLLYFAKDFKETKIIVKDEITSNIFSLIELVYGLLSNSSNVEMQESVSLNAGTDSQVLVTDSIEQILVSLKIKQTNPENYMLYTWYLDDNQTNSVFLDLKNNFEIRYSYYTKAIQILPWAIAIFFLLFVFFLCIIGYKKEFDGIYQNRFDQIPYEIILCSTVFLIGSILYGIFYFITENDSLDPLYILSEKFIEQYNLQVIAFLLYTLLCTLFFTFIITTIRRLKAHTFLSSFLCFRICFYIFKNIFALLFFCIHHSLDFIHRLKDIIKDFFLYRTTAMQTLLLLIVFTFYLFITIILGFYENPFLCFFFILLGIAVLGFFLLRVAGNINCLREVTRQIMDGNLDAKVKLNNVTLPMKELIENVNNIGNGLAAAVDEKLKSERMKTELITNVSHDIKTPLTSIINYVNLLKKIDLQNETAKGFLSILEEKSWRLKTLIEDLVEASKASSGTLAITLEKLNLCELIKQAGGEFEDRFEARNLELILTLPEEGIPVLADGRSTYRIIENLFSNVNKYAMPGTRIYVDACNSALNAVMSIKNISANQLNITSDELMERFVRGDTSRNTEGSGLGLSIAKSLAELQHGTFELFVDGDLFKAVVTLPLYLGELEPTQTLIDSHKSNPTLELSAKL